MSDNKPIVKKISQIFRVVFLSSLIAPFLVAAAVYAATTIGTNIDTGGNLTVSGNATTTGSHYIGGNVGIGTNPIATLTFSAIAPPTQAQGEAMSYVGNGSGGDIGGYNEIYYVAFYGLSGNTEVSTGEVAEIGSVFGGADDYTSVNISNIPVSSDSRQVTIGRKICRSSDTSPFPRVVVTIANNASTVAADNISDANLINQPACQFYNTTQYLQLNGLQVKTSELLNYEGLSINSGGESRNSILIGHNAGKNLLWQNNTGNTFIGINAGKTITGTASNVIIGNNAGHNLTAGNSNTFVGSNAGKDITTGTYNVIIGQQAEGLGYTNTGDRNIVIGSEAGAYGNFSPQSSIAIGEHSRLVNGTGNISIGQNASIGSSNVNYSIALGMQASFNASNQLVVGSNVASINDIYIGKGVTNSTPTGFTLNATGGSGTDIAGANLTIAGGKGTGSANGGSILFQTSDALGSGTTLQSLSTKTTISSIRLVVSPPSSETITAGATITADACGTIKQITSAGAVTTNTTNTFTAPASANNGCCMDVLNVGSFNITLDNNANFKSAGAVDVVLTSNDTVRVCSNGSAWYQIGAAGVN